MNINKKRAAALFIILIMVLSGVASFMFWFYNRRTKEWQNIT